MPVSGLCTPASQLKTFPVVPELGTSQPELGEAVTHLSIVFLVASDPQSLD